jgi:ABC-type transporter Mla subunit MlaD
VGEADRRSDDANHRADEALRRAEELATALAHSRELLSATSAVLNRLQSNAYDRLGQKLGLVRCALSEGDTDA